jgi:hypothetical protein
MLYPTPRMLLTSCFSSSSSSLFFSSLFSFLIPYSAESDRECIVMQMRLWEKMNLGAAIYGQREMGSRYVPIKVEDLILPLDVSTRANAIIHLFRRLGVELSDYDDGVPRDINNNDHHIDVDKDEFEETQSPKMSDVLPSTSSSSSSFLRAVELSDKIFGSSSLRSHFSIERWGGCDPAIIDEVEAAGLKGLMHFGYLPWRELAEVHVVDGKRVGEKYGCSVGASQIQVPGVK